MITKSIKFFLFFAILVVSACNDGNNPATSDPEAVLTLIKSGNDSELIMDSSHSIIPDVHEVTAIRYTITDLETNEITVIDHGTDHRERRNHFLHAGNYLVELSMSIENTNDINFESSYSSTLPITIYSDYIDYYLDQNEECPLKISTYDVGDSSDSVDFDAAISVKSKFDNSDCDSYYTLDLDDIKEYVQLYLSIELGDNDSTVSNTDTTCLYAYGASGKDDDEGIGGEGGVSATITTLQDLKDSNDTDDYLRFILGYLGGSTVISTQYIDDNSTALWDASSDGQLLLVAGGGGEAASSGDTGIDGGDGKALMADDSLCSSKQGGYGTIAVVNGDWGVEGGGGGTTNQLDCSTMLTEDNIETYAAAGSAGSDGDSGTAGVGGEGTYGWYNGDFSSRGDYGNGGTAGNNGGGGFGGGGSADDYSTGGAGGNFSYPKGSNANSDYIDYCQDLSSYTIQDSNYGYFEWIFFVDSN
ncbi:hypothetical protein [uncultured Shewanella sp.]|uniref:hypothetical protein n=1 Tax=uncultured Shewanella sp. TaxID=173975 RepID=UPI0026239757|nr:hypothetical protein [uncultured Shewanella sp.]